MAQIFPLPKATFADKLLLAGNEMNLRRGEEQSGFGSGEWLTHKLMPDYWELSATTIVMPFDQLHELQGYLNALGSMEAAYLYDYSRQYPIDDPDGSIIGALSPDIASIDPNRKELSIDGLPAGYTLQPGDMIQITYDSNTRDSLHQLLSPATADGTGKTGLFEIRPTLRPAVINGDDVTLIKPAAKMKIVPGSDRVQNVSPLHGSLSFTARQTYRAN